jgi:AraC family transcriptional regulator of adaptative response / DNA-3-methyladenine glycosylase II
VERFGTPIDTPYPALTHMFPDAATLAAADPEEIGTLGIVRQRVGALQALAARWPPAASNCTAARRWSATLALAARCPASATGRRR